MTRRVLLASLRLPLTMQATPDGLRVVPSPGGVASGIGSLFDPATMRWLGWAGGEPDEAARAAMDLAGYEPIAITPAEIERFYHGYANAVLWPVLHGQLARLPLEIEGWAEYDAVNRRMAERLAALWTAGTLVWIHDYQLMRVAWHLRALIPAARIGFFLHVPFPAADLFAVLPERRLLLEGLLAADLVGVHTAAFADHMRDAATTVADASGRLDRLEAAGRSTRVVVRPLGLDAELFRTRDEPATRGHERLLLGIDRLDYTKGIPRRLLAFERLLERHPELIGAVHLLQIAVPTRDGTRAYRRFRDEVEAMVGRINGRFGQPDWTPIRYLRRSLSREALRDLYREADVMLVTPVRDGLNLVAKKYAAARIDGDGVLVLSEFAGVCDELGGALIVNPYDINGTADALFTALTLPDAERRQRMQALGAQVATSSGRQWADAFLSTLAEGAEVRQLPIDTEPGTLLALVRRAARLHLLLDYDGTLVPHVARPDDAAPDAALLRLLRLLAGRRNTEVSLVSGRSRADLDRWFGELPISLHAEHGGWSRRTPTAPWRGHAPTGEPWFASAAIAMQRTAAATPGSHLETKHSVLTWHWRGVESTLAARRLRDLRRHLHRLLEGEPVTLLEGDHILEARPAGITKGRVAAELSTKAATGTCFLSAGDDSTDDELFAGLPPDAITIAVGGRPQRARYRLPDPTALRALLEGIVDQLPLSLAPSPARARS